MSTQMVQPALPGTLVFVALVLGLCAWLVLATQRAGAALGEAPQVQRRTTLITAGACLAWLAITGLASGSGVLASSMFPPPLAVFVVFSLGVPLWAAWSGFGTRLVHGVPIAGLVGIQAFRLPLELILHSWKDQGVLPIQMTFEGRNLDIITGVLAVSVGLLLRAKPNLRAAIWIFNLIGFALVVNVASIAMLSSPLPIRRYFNEPPVLLAFHFPYGWIVPFCVGGALFLHVLTFRWLWWTRITARQQRLQTAS